MYDASQFGLLLIACALTLVAAWWTCRSIIAGVYPATVGAVFGGLMFVMVPTLYCAFTGEVPVPIDFERTSVTSVKASRDLVAIALAVMATAGVVLTTFCTEYVVHHVLARLSQGWHRNDSMLAVQQSSTSLLSQLAISVGVYVLALGINVVLTGAAFEGGHWQRSRDEYLAEQGAKGQLILMLSVGAGLAVLAFAIQAAAARRRPILFLCLVCPLLCLVDVLARGNRILVVQSAVIIISMAIMCRAWSTLIVITAALPPLMWVFSIYRFVRSQVFNVTSASEFVSIFLRANSSFDEPLGEKLLASVESLAYISLVFVIKTTRASDALTFAHMTFLKPILVLIPRSLMPDKPRPISLIVGEDFLHVPTSVNPTLMGEALVNGWYFGIPVAGILLVLLIALPVALAIREPVTRYCMIVMLVLTAMRQPLDTIFQQSVATAIMFVVIHLLGTQFASMSRRSGELC